VAKIQLGEGDAGIVYTSDVTPAAAEKVNKLDIPDKYNVLATYPIAVLQSAPQADLAAKFVDYVLSADGQAILQKWGFIPEDAKSSSAAPAQSTASTAPIKVTDALGREVTFEKVPERIVIAGKATTLVADALYLFPEASERLAGIELRSQSAKKFLDVVDPAFGDKTMLEMNAAAEQIAPLKPDVVVMKSAMAEKLGTPLEQLGIPVVYVDLETPETFAKDITALGQLFGNPDRAQEIQKFYQDRVDQISAATKDLPADQKPRVLLLQHTKQGEEVAFNIPPAAWLQTTIARLAGGEPVWTEASEKGGWTVVNFEQIAAWDPDQIYIVSYAGDSDKITEQLKADDKWAALKAVKNDQLYGFAGDFYSWDQPDPRWVLGMSWLFSKIQPDQASGVDIRQELNQFYTQMYGLTDSVIEEKVVPLLYGNLQ
jgi:iron complex transport system substrate-binding protein